MSWKFNICTGTISHDGLNIGRGYSGRGDGRGNPKLCAVANVGPIPPGKYSIGAAYEHPHLGPVVMNLEPLPGTETHGRSLFRIHGDSLTTPGQASHGCVCCPPAVRRAINASSDKVLEVVQ
jgi:hypothetical protein